MVTAPLKHNVDVVSSTPVEIVKEKNRNAFEELYTHIYEKRDLYTLIYQGRYPNTTFESMADQQVTLSKQQYELQTAPVNPDLYLHCDIRQIYAIITWWIKGNWEYSPDYITKQAAALHAPVHTYASFTSKF